MFDKLGLVHQKHWETVMTDPSIYPGTPRWVKAFAIAGALLILLILIVLHLGGSPRHGIPTASKTERTSG